VVHGLKSNRPCEPPAPVVDALVHIPARPLWYIPPVHPDRERLIRLQDLDLRAAEARRLQTAIPETQRALDQKLEEARAEVAATKDRLAASQTDRRALEKDLTAIQTRLSRYKDQLMEVKTNREYHAMQHEIETAQGEVQRLEDQMLELMVAGDEIGAALKGAEDGVKQAEVQRVREHADLDRQLAETETTLETLLRERAALVAQIARPAVAMYEQVARGRKGVAVSVARDGLCSECHVRLRPMIYAEVRHNATLVQCDHCQRILYFVPPTEAMASAT
jgi:uncharacterized protein